MKPDIVFFGEKLPNAFDKSLKEDREQVDLLIVMGSSLKVAPVSDIMRKYPSLFLEYGIMNLVLKLSELLPTLLTLYFFFNDPNRLVAQLGAPDPNQQDTYYSHGL